MPLDRPFPPRADVLAVVVCYHPGANQIAALARRVLASGRSEVLVVDNSESIEESSRLRDELAEVDVDVIVCGRNSGVAGAHNLGLAIARQRGNKAVLLLDQDTQLEEDTLSQLLAAYQKLREDGEPVAGVGAGFVDPRNGYESPFFRLGHLRMRAVDNTAGGPTECDLLISSGCLISVDAAKDIGEMDGSLFIDYADMEWCARARSRGWKVFGVPAARMHHTVGDAAMLLLGRLIAVHQPQRQYYLIRNAFLFARKPYLPFNWRAHLVYRALTQVAMFALLCSPRRQRLHWMLLGLWDGLRGRGGRLGEGREKNPDRPVLPASARRASEQRQSELVD